MDLLRKLNYTKAEGPAKGQPKLETAIDAAEMILTLAPETNGQVAVKAWQALSEITGREHTHLALNKEDEKIRFRDIQAQPRKIISSPTWSGTEDEHVSYNAGYTNVHELIRGARCPAVSRCIRITSGCATSAKACWSIGRRLTPVR
nr:Respiratory nitrate reductase 1 alpha chain [Klebsiella pneumoniae]